MELGDYWSFLRRRWISIVVFAVLGVLVAGVITLLSPKSYTSTAQDFVALTSTSNEANPLAGAQFAAQRVKSYTEIVSSPAVLEPVIAKLGLNTTPAGLAGQVSVVNPPQTVLLLVSAVDASPVRAAEIANAVALQLGNVIEQLETPAGSTTPPVKVTLTKPAVAPSSPSSPRTTLNLAIGLVIGLICGIAWALLRDALDRTVKSVRELDQLSGAPMLGRIVFDKEAQRQRLSALDSTATRSEGYRTLRTNLQFVRVDSPLRVVVVTSPAPGDGKSTVSCNLAIALAQTGKKVCLLEADLRRPRLSEYMGVDGSVGLTDVLANQRTLDQVIQPWGRGLLDIVGPGPVPPNPSELLNSQQMQSVLDQLKERYDIVIVDSSPLLAVADAAIVSRYADGAILVVRYGKSTRDGISHAAEALAQVNDVLLGTVLNAVPMTRHNYNSYGYGYESEAPSSPQPDESAPAPQTPQETLR